MKVTLNCGTTPMIHVGGQIMNAEEYMIYAARISSPKNRANHETAPGLLKYLVDHGHWSPFEMISYGFEIETSRAIAQQMLRHRSFSFQEFSQRYAEATDLEPFQLRAAGSTNRQSSIDAIGDPALIGLANRAVNEARKAYKVLVDNGVAKETARMILPLSTRTTVIMHGTLRSWIHFFDQRCSEHAQKEIRDIAIEIRRRLAEEVPWTAAALNW